MKKLLMILSLSLLSSGSATSNELSSINKLIENGYKIISEDIVSRSDSNRFIKTFTLQNKKFEGHLLMAFFFISYKSTECLNDIVVNLLKIQV